MAHSRFVGTVPPKEIVAQKLKIAGAKLTECDLTHIASGSS
jgi:hypothetical protein